MQKVLENQSLNVENTLSPESKNDSSPPLSLDGILKTDENEISCTLKNTVGSSDVQSQEKLVEPSQQHVLNSQLKSKDKYMKDDNLEVHVEVDQDDNVIHGSDGGDNILKEKIETDSNSSNTNNINEATCTPTETSTIPNEASTSTTNPPKKNSKRRKTAFLDLSLVRPRTVRKAAAAAQQNIKLSLDEHKHVEEEKSAKNSSYSQLKRKKKDISSSPSTVVSTPSSPKTCDSEKNVKKKKTLKTSNLQENHLEDTTIRQTYLTLLEDRIVSCKCSFIFQGTCHMCKNDFKCNVVTWCSLGQVSHSFCFQHLTEVLSLENQKELKDSCFKCLVCLKKCPCSICSKSLLDTIASMKILQQEQEEENVCKETRKSTSLTPSAEEGVSLNQDKLNKSSSWTTTPLDQERKDNSLTDVSFSSSSSTCLQCAESGSLLCCLVCSRAFHRRCLPLNSEQSHKTNHLNTNTNTNTDENAVNWICHVCFKGEQPTLAMLEEIQSQKTPVQKCRKILEILEEYPFKEMFKDLIQSPEDDLLFEKFINLNDIRKKLDKKKKYTSKEFDRDLRLIWNNCLKFNPVNSLLYKRAIGFSQLYDTLCKTIDP